MKFNHERYERLCTEQGKSPSAVAEEAGVSKNLPGRWKNGGAEPRSKSIKKLAECLGVSMDELIIEDHNALHSKVIGSAVVQGNSGSTIRFNSNAQVHNENQGAAAQLTEQEAELLRIYRSLDMKGKTVVMSFAFAEEERQASK